MTEELFFVSAGADNPEIVEICLPLYFDPERRPDRALLGEKCIVACKTIEEAIQNEIACFGKIREDLKGIWVCTRKTVLWRVPLPSPSPVPK